MSLSPDTADLAAPDPSDYGRKRKAAGPSLTIWALITFGLLCVLAGMLIAAYGPRLVSTPRRPEPAPVPTASAMVDPPAPAYTPLAGIAPPIALNTSDVSALQGRIASLERVQAVTADAAAGALTAAALSAAAQDSGPFEAEAAAAERVLPLSADVRALRRLSEQGAPSRATLQAGFADPAARAVVAQRDPGGEASLPARILHALSSIVSIRRVAATQGTGFDATLARAEQQVASGDLETALTTLNALPPASRATFDSWRAGAQRRVEIDSRIASLREASMAELARAMRERP
jgi:hypothetical protein